MRNFITEYLFLSLIVAGISLFMIDVFADAIDSRIQMQPCQEEN